MLRIHFQANSQHVLKYNFRLVWTYSARGIMCLLFFLFRSSVSPHHSAVLQNPYCLWEFSSITPFSPFVSSFSLSYQLCNINSQLQIINLIISLYITSLLPIVFLYTCNLSVLQLFSCYSFIISSPFPCAQGYGGSWVKWRDYILEMISPLC